MTKLEITTMPVSYIGRMSFCGWLTRMLEDKVLVRRFKSGDVAALERIYEKYKNDLLALAVSLTNDITAAVRKLALLLSDPFRVLSTYQGLFNLLASGGLFRTSLLSPEG